MSAKVSAITDRLVKDFLPFAEKMQEEGRSRPEIERAFQNYMGHKSRKTFLRPAMTRIKTGISRFLESIKHLPKSDSSTERVLYDLLKERKMKFVHQKQIGPYRADFVMGSLIVEVDGPQHQGMKGRDKTRDRYLGERGYTVMRIPAKVVATTPLAVIQAIQEEIENMYE